MQKGFLMDLLPFIAADIEELRVRNIVRRIQYDAATTTVGFERFLHLDWSLMGLVSFVGWRPYRHADGTILNDINCAQIKIAWGDRLLLSWSPEKQILAKFF